MSPALLVALSVALLALRPSSPMPKSTDARRPEPFRDPRYAGASPCVQGDPAGTVLAVPGLARHFTAQDRAELVSLAAELRIPVDSLAALFSSESGCNPSKINPSGAAAGLIQITTGANLVPFVTKAKVREVAGWPVSRQLREVVRPYFARFGARLENADPGRVYLANFVPAFLGRAESTVVATAPAGWKYEGLTAEEAERFRGSIYAANWQAFDRRKRGFFTVGDVYDYAARPVRQAKGTRL